VTRQEAGSIARDGSEGFVWNALTIGLQQN
jgi:hypothetical protein